MITYVILFLKIRSLFATHVEVVDTYVANIHLKIK